MVQMPKSWLLLSDRRQYCHLFGPEFSHLKNCGHNSYPLGPGFEVCVKKQ